MQNMKVWLVFVFASCGFVLVSTSKCDRTPEGSSAKKSPPDGRYKLKIQHDPQHFMPGETYNISLEVVPARPGVPSSDKFTGFFIGVEKFNEYSYDDLGSFEIIPMTTVKFSEKCRNLVTHASTYARPSVAVLWKAPMIAVPGECLVFKATVIEHRDVWFSDEGFLNKILCADDAETGESSQQALEECTACHEAKYELTFEGLWSRQTHPKDFPSNGWLTRFSDIIGASHAKNHSFWYAGQQSTDGLKEVVEHGSTGSLESELKDQGEEIRTIIKARGISYPNMTGKTFAVFRVDSKHHLVSLVSMIYPSPDWFVGVSGLELCLSNGSWAEQRVLNLYPYDAGTDSGPTYTASDQPTLPREAIRRIKPNQPNDPRSPFHDVENKEMKPMARLTLTRQRLYEKNCVEQEEKEEDGEEDEDDEKPQRGAQRGPSCKLTPWEDWSECSVECGDGIQTRVREYQNSGDEDNCSKKLKETRRCTNSDCPDENDEQGDGKDDSEDKDDDDDANETIQTRPGSLDCSLNDWSEWSDCSVDCGKGEKTRTREYKNSNNRARCRSIKQVKISETRECEGDKCAGDINDEKPVHDEQKCPLTAWSEWSKCSITCGVGEKVRVRIPRLNRLKKDELIVPYVELYAEFNEPSGFDDDDEGSNEEVKITEIDIEDIADSSHVCYGANMVERMPCTGTIKKCEGTISGVPSHCFQKPLRKVCHDTPANKWFFKNDTQHCALFPYTGCETHANKYDSESECLEICGSHFPKDSKALQSESLLDGRVDCVMSRWKHVPCNATCGEGVRVKHRHIIKHSENGGRQCPRSLVHSERCYKDCGQTKATRASKATKAISPSLPSANSINPHHHHHQCRYSEWSAWSPCSKTCGDFGVQIRTRTVLNHLHSHLCSERLEERRCEVMPCLVGSGYGYNYNYNYRS